MRIYEKHPHMDAYRVGGSFTPYAIVAVNKRLSNSELAAEVHSAELSLWVRRARCDTYPRENHLWDHYERGLHESSALERFATLPHFDE